MDPARAKALGIYYPRATLFLFTQCFFFFYYVGFVV